MIEEDKEERLEQIELEEIYKEIDSLQERINELQDGWFQKRLNLEKLQKQRTIKTRRKQIFY